MSKELIYTSDCSCPSSCPDCSCYEIGQIQKNISDPYFDGKPIGIISNNDIMILLRKLIEYLRGLED